MVLTVPGTAPDTHTPASSARSTEIPRWISFAHSDGELARTLNEILGELGVERPLLVFGRSSREMLGQSLLIDVGTQLDATAVDLHEGTVEEALSLAERLERENLDAVIGVGGGRTLDVAKFVAARGGAPFAALPTQASHDGLASPVAVIPQEDGKVATHGARAAVAVLIPVHAIRQASRRTIVSGIGDLAANDLAIRDWQWARDFHDEPYDDYAALLARSGAELAIARRELYGPGDEFQDEDIEILVHGLVLSGLAMSVSGTSRPCSGSEHLVSHAFDALGVGDGLHGEQVAVGLALAARFYEGSFDRAVTLLRNVGAPLRPDQIGISREEALEAVRIVPSVRPGRQTRLTAALEADERYVLEQAELAWFGDE